MNTDQYINPAVIGFWRCGATTEQICIATGLFYTVIQKIINEYKKKIT